MTANKWQKNVIVGVSFKDKEEKKHILQVKVKKDLGETLGNEETLKRKIVVNMIDEQGEKFVTAFFKEGKWKIGENVHTISYNGIKFIRTDNNNTEEDNLGKLPEFD